MALIQNSNNLNLMKKLFFLFFLLISLMSSCSKNDIKIDKNNLLIGTWIYSHSTVDAFVYTRAQEFTQTPGYRFNLDGTLVERNLSGFCATPPVSYSDYSGNWTFLKENLIQVNRNNYEGSKSYKLDIQLVNADSLKVLQIN
jgi:hypothetical protein